MVLWKSLFLIGLTVISLNSVQSTDESAIEPTAEPTFSPSLEPTYQPTIEPTSTNAPTVSPTYNNYMEMGYTVTQTINNVNCTLFEGDVDSQDIFTQSLASFVTSAAVTDVASFFTTYSLTEIGNASVAIDTISCVAADTSTSSSYTEFDYLLSFSSVKYLRKLMGFSATASSFQLTANGDTQIQSTVSYLYTPYDINFFSLYSASSGAITTAVSNGALQAKLLAAVSGSTCTLCGVTITSSDTPTYGAPQILNVHYSSSPSKQPVVAPSPTSPSNSSSDSTTTAIIVGIIVPLAVICLALLIFGYYIHKKRQTEQQEREQRDIENGRMLNNNNNNSTPGFFNRANNNKNVDKTRANFESNSAWTGTAIYDKGKSNINPEMLSLIKRIDWTEVSINSESPEAAVIGKGSFGVVVKALWREFIPASASVEKPNKELGTAVSPAGTLSDEPKDVVVKVMTRSVGGTATANHEKVLTMALEEVAVVKEAESKIVYKDCIIKVYGVCYGDLPQFLCDTMNIYENVDAVGIVMRLEGGGTLDEFIHNDKKGSSPVSMIEKLRLLTGIARGIAELHSAGVVHADIKPDNVLLSSNDPPEVRLADFGLSVIKEESHNLVMSSLAETSHIRGTPIYCAPEMLINPYDEQVTDKVAKSSRKTDIYAFAILMWEVICQEKPFSHIKSEPVLGAKVHQGERPPIEHLPKDCPPKIKTLIESCWHRDRSQRRSAIDCFSILQFQYGLLSKSSYDVFISHQDMVGTNSDSIPARVFHRLTQFGYKVCNHQSVIAKVNADGTTATNASVNASLGQSMESQSQSQSSESQKIQNPEKVKFNAISSSKVVIACLSQSYQDNEKCIQELSEAKKAKKTIVPIFMEKKHIEWASQDLIYLCQLRSPALVSFDFSDISAEGFESEEGPKEEVLKTIYKGVDKIMHHLKEIDCYPAGFKDPKTDVRMSEVYSKSVVANGNGNGAASPHDLKIEVSSFVVDNPSFGSLNPVSPEKRKVLPAAIASETNGVDTGGESKVNDKAVSSETAKNSEPPSAPPVMEIDTTNNNNNNVPSTSSSPSKNDSPTHSSINPIGVSFGMTASKFTE